MSLLRVDYHSNNAQQQFCASLSDTGFAVLDNHPISATLIAAVYDEWQTFFQQSDDDKLHYLYNKPAQDGFVPSTIAETAKGNDVIDLKEYYSYYPWGQFPNNMSDNTLKLYAQLNNLASELLNWIEAALPADIAAHLSMPLSQMIADCAKTMLRILHYPPLTGDEPVGAIRAAEHEDICLLTLLVGATDAGLQLKLNNGQWQDVPSDEGSIVVNIGDMLQMCTQGHYRSTTHRVVNPTGAAATQSRLSMPLFLHARPEVALSNDYTADQYLTERLQEIGVL